MRKEKKTIALLKKHEQVKLKNWLEADYFIYNHYLKEFKTLMIQYGEERLRADVKRLRELSNLWLQECVQQSDGKHNTTDPDFIPWHNDTKVLSLHHSKTNNSTCRRLVMSEMGLTEILQKSQFGPIRDDLIKAYFA